MPTNFTENYQLSQWEPGDKVVRTDFNEDNAKIDGALKALDTLVAGKADASALSQEVSARTAAVSAVQSTLSSLQTTVAGKQNASSAVKIKAGSYTGDGAASRTISVGFTPRAVLVTDQRGTTFSNSGSNTYMYGGLATAGSPLTFDTSNILEITTNGFIVHYQTFPGSYTIGTNENRKVYNYLAIG